MPRMTDEEFEAAVEEALAGIPERFLGALENVAVVVEDEPDDYHFEIMDEPDCLGASVQGDELLGLYDGVSLSDRADGYDGGLPDVITVFKGPHERCFSSRAELVEEIGKTVVHEIGHYFGIDDDRLHEMGY
ncbi:Zn-dependent protease [Gordonibacter sp. An230]|uniref:metallopeptidase family protein n=1 Tax=Gordonibacter sp. An230 TaxID=1965592 RepID=UPI000B3A9301|nr:metallopeptidase family protein [Gordonibacter sp. An230]OUO91423.1 Zn-dependent protease [Gordonibacter sp. An230]